MPQPVVALRHDAEHAAAGDDADERGAPAGGTVKLRTKPTTMPGSVITLGSS